MQRRAFPILMLAAMAAPPGLMATQPAAPRTYQARLSTVPIDLGMASTIAGSGSLTATLEGRTLTVSGKFSGLKTPATVARLHRSPNRGIRGAAIADLAVTAATSGEVSGTADLTAAQVEDLAKGRLYVQLHSEKAPDGNLWGWLLPK